MIRNRFKSRKGFTLTELIVVIAIIAIMVGASIGVGAKQVRSSRIQETTSFLQTMASNIEEFIMDNGFLDYEAATTDADIRAFMTKMSDTYLSCGIDVSSITRMAVTGTNMKGFCIDLTLVIDSWDMPYRMYYLTDYETAGAENAFYFISVASPGPNTGIAAAGTKAGYYNAAANGGVDDDIVVIMESR